MSFSKQEPPQARDAYKNGIPILLSEPTIVLKSYTDAPVISQSSDREFMELIL